MAQLLPDLSRLLFDIEPSTFVMLTGLPLGQVVVAKRWEKPLSFDWMRLFDSSALQQGLLSSLMITVNVMWCSRRGLCRRNVCTSHADSCSEQE
jgi:hypothetical protein